MCCCFVSLLCHRVVVLVVVVVVVVVVLLSCFALSHRPRHAGCAGTVTLRPVESTSSSRECFY